MNAVSNFRPSSLGTIPRLVQDSASRFAERPAFEGDGHELRFDELGELALRSARAFMAAGIQPGDRVAVWAPNQLEWVLAAVGLQSAGGVLVPMNTRFKASEAGYQLRKSGARMVFTVDEFLGERYAEMVASQELPALEGIVLFSGAHPKAETWETFLSGGDAVTERQARERIDAAAATDLADIMFTSGTTGNPKGVMTTHEQNLRAFESWSEVVGLRAGDRYLVVNPFFHTFGYKAGWLSCIMRGVTCLPHKVFDVPEVLRRVGEERISALPGVPSLYQSILMHPDRGKCDLSHLRLAVTGAAPTPVELIRRMRDELGFETVITGYGLTESTGIATMCRDGDAPEIIANSSGRAIPDVEVRCVDDEGKEVPRGKPGEVVVRGYNVMQGYFEDEEETRKTIDAEGWLHTGDIGVMDEQGYLDITDRKKDMFIMGGFNCYPAEIEALLFEHPQIAQVAVLGIPDERMGEVGQAFVVPEPGTAPSPEELRIWCREHMANYKVPRRIELIDELPMNATGKVQKFILRERALGGAAEPS
ncbi:MAG: fatty acid--CoA ligase family protein [bacterium]|nr:fatty acid--CoA ligase family protein [bacterium]